MGRRIPDGGNASHGRCNGSSWPWGRCCRPRFRCYWRMLGVCRYGWIDMPALREVKPPTISIHSPEGSPRALQEIEVLEVCTAWEIDAEALNVACKTILGKNASAEVVLHSQ